MASSPSLLLLDTCLLLDVIRAPMRENIGLHDVQAIRTLTARQAEQPATFTIAVTQQVRDEYTEHVPKIEEDTARALSKLIDRTNEMLTMVNTFDAGLLMPGNLQINAPQVVSNLRAMADSILVNCLTIPHTPGDSQAAGSRVLQAKPPATRAKQSFKDCLIVEGVLRHVAEGRTAGTLGKAVFASSNTADFHQGHGSLHPHLRAEFDACGLGFAPSWSAARYELDRT